MEIVASLIQNIQDEIFTSKDVKVIAKEVDSSDKFARASALDTWGEIYRLVGDRFWKMVDK